MITIGKYQNAFPRLNPVSLSYADQRLLLGGYERMHDDTHHCGILEKSLRHTVTSIVTLDLVHHGEVP